MRAVQHAPVRQRRQCSRNERATGTLVRGPSAGRSGYGGAIEEEDPEKFPGMKEGNLREMMREILERSWVCILLAFGGV